MLVITPRFECHWRDFEEGCGLRQVNIIFNFVILYLSDTSVVENTLVIASLTLSIALVIFQMQASLPLSPFLLSPLRRCVYHVHGAA